VREETEAIDYVAWDTLAELMGREGDGAAAIMAGVQGLFLINNGWAEEPPMALDRND